jgi:peptide chain release factor 1
MLEKLEAIKIRWEDVEEQLSNPDTMQDMKRFAQLNKEYKDLSKIVEEYKVYKNVMSNIDANKEILSTEKDQEMREMAKEELDELLKQQEEIEERVRLMLIPVDPEDAKMRCLRSGVVQAVMKQRFLPEIYTACTAASLSKSAGR